MGFYLLSLSLSFLLFIPVFRRWSKQETSNLFLGCAATPTLIFVLLPFLFGLAIFNNEFGLESTPVSVSVKNTTNKKWSIYYITFWNSDDRKEHGVYKQGRLSSMQKKGITIEKDGVREFWVVGKSSGAIQYLHKQIDDSTNRTMNNYLFEINGKRMPSNTDKAFAEKIIRDFLSEWYVSLILVSVNGIVILSSLIMMLVKKRRLAFLFKKILVRNKS